MKGIDIPSGQIHMHTASGDLYYPLAPRARDVNIHTIAQHLACTARWNGATQHRKDPFKIFYSVAEHSVYVATVLVGWGRPDLALQGLMHDAAEAYLGDLIRPLKHSPEFRAPFKVVEDRNEAVIFPVFGLPAALDPLVKKADEAVCAAEYQQVVPGSDRHPPLFHDDAVVADVEIQMLLPFEAKELFVAVWHSLETVGVAA